MATVDITPRVRVTAQSLLIAFALTGDALARPANPIGDRLDAEPRLEPLVPVLQQCIERRRQHPTPRSFFRTEYGATCGSVMLAFGLVTQAELAEYWQQ